VKSITQQPHLKALPASSISIAIDSYQVRYGFVVPGEALVRNSTITIITNHSGASLFLQEDHPLQSAQKDLIPNTSCDTGSCTPNLADIWNSPLTFGFGIRCENSKLCSNDFRNGTYRPLADTSQAQIPAEILSSPVVGSVTTNVFYKLNISPNLASKPYTHTVSYIVTPNL
jgi:hypothetical protein